MNFKDKLFLLGILVLLNVVGAWLGYVAVTGRPVTAGAAKATEMSLSATPTETIAATPTTTTTTPTQMATPAATATATPPALAETATQVARDARYYRDRALDLEATATREAKWEADRKEVLQAADKRLRDAGCYKNPCVIISWEGGYDRWESVLADGKSVADGNSIFNKKVLVEWDNYNYPERVEVNPSKRKTRWPYEEPYAVWVYITAWGELRLTELPVGEIYGN